VGDSVCNFLLGDFALLSSSRVIMTPVLIGRVDPLLNRLRQLLEEGEGHRGPFSFYADSSGISLRRRSTYAISSVVGGSSQHALYSGARPERAGRQGTGFDTMNHSRAHPLLVSRSSKLG